MQTKLSAVKLICALIAIDELVNSLAMNASGVLSSMSAPSQPLLREDPSCYTVGWCSQGGYRTERER